MTVISIDGQLYGLMMPSGCCWQRWPMFWRKHELSQPEGWIPDTDIVEREGNIVVRVDLPGVCREDIHVSLHENVLMVKDAGK